MSARGEAAQGCPPAVLDWMAWYPEQLSAEQRGVIESHAAQCLACRQELAMIQGEEPALAEGELPAADRVYAKVRERIEAGAPARPNPLQATPPRRSRSERAGLRGFALAASLAVALLGGFALANVWPGSGDAVYRPATPPPVESANAGPLLEIVVRPEVPVSRMNEALAAVGGRIVSGPSKLGVFVVSLPAGSDAARAAESLRDEETGVATYAELARR